MLALPVAAALLVAGCAAPGSAAATAATASGYDVLASLQLNKLPGGAAVGEGSLWVINYAEGSISRIDALTNRLGATIPVGDPRRLPAGCGPSTVHDAPTGSFIVRGCDVPSAITVAAGSLWIARNDTRTVERMNPTTATVTATIPVGVRVLGMAGTASAVWLAAYEDDAVLRIDALTNQVFLHDVLIHGPSAFAISPRSLWVARTRGKLVSRLDLLTGQALMDVATDGRPFPMALAAGSVWVRNEQGNTVTRIDDVTGQVQARIPVDPFYGIDGVDSIAVVNGKVWIGGLNLQEIDPASNRIVRNLPISGRPLAAGDGTLWVIGIAGAVTRIRVR